MSEREIPMKLVSRPLVLLGALIGCALGGCQRSPEPAAVVVGPAAKEDTAAGDRAEDLKHARLVAEGFLTAVAAGNAQQAQGFCTPGQRTRVASITLQNRVTWVIEGDAIAAAGREATFKGTITSSTGKRQQFVALVVKTQEVNLDRWLVDAFSLSLEQ